MADIVDAHRRSVEFFDTRAKSIRDDQYDDPTPCTDWSVRDLLNHLVNENLWTVPLMEGKTIAEVGDRFDGDCLGSDPKGAWEQSSKEALAAAQEDGVVDRTIHVSWGEISGEEYLNQLFLDHLIHGWDMSRALGMDERLDPELVEICYEYVKKNEDNLRGSGAFGDNVSTGSPGDDRQTELLALLGRRA